MTLTAKQPGLAILIAVTAVGPLALNIFIPSMPGLRAEFGADHATVQLTLTAYLFAIAIAQLFLGPLSDRFGRRPVLLAGLALFVAASLGCAAAETIEQLIVGRIAQATGGCSGLVLSRAIVRDLHGRDAAASKLGYITMAMVVAPMVAPTIGGFLDVWSGWRAGFVFTAAVGLVVLAASWARLHETNRQLRAMPGLTGMVRDYWALLRCPAFAGNAFTGAFAVAIFFSFLAGAPYATIELMGRSAGEYGLYFMLSATGYMSGNYLSGRYAERVGPDRMIAIGNLIALAGATAMAAFAAAGWFAPLAIFLPMLVIGLSNGLTIPGTLANAVSVRPELAGAASGFAGALQLVMGGLGTVIVGLAQDDTHWGMIATMAGFATLAFLTGRLSRRVQAPVDALAERQT